MKKRFLFILIFTLFFKQSVLRTEAASIEPTMANIIIQPMAAVATLPIQYDISIGSDVKYNIKYALIYYTNGTPGHAYDTCEFLMGSSYKNGEIVTDSLSQTCFIVQYANEVNRVELD